MTNTSGKTLSYTVTDTPEALPTGVTGGSWTATGPTIAGGGEGTRTGGWTGEVPNTQLAKGLIPAGATHTYTVSRTVTVAASVTDAQLDCPSGGIDNTATITTASAATRRRWVREIVLDRLRHEKEVVRPTA